MPKYSEEYLAERRRINKKRRLTQRRIEKRKSKPKGFLYPKLSWQDALDKYSHYLDSLVEVTLATCSSQTEQFHPNKSIRLLSKRILRLVPEGLHLEREDIVQDVLYIWWRIFYSYQENPKTYRNRLGHYLVLATAWRLPFIVERYSLKREFTTEHIPHAEYIDDLDFLLNGSEVYPYSLLGHQDRILYYYLTMYPNRYTKIARLLRISTTALKQRISSLQSYLKQELDNANPERSSSGRINVTASDHQGTN